MTVKVIHTLMTAALLLASCASTQSPLTPSAIKTIEAQVETRFEDLVSATTSNDYDRYFSLFDKDSFSATSTDGSIIQSFDVFKLKYEPQFAQIKSYKSLDFDPVKIRVIDPNNVILLNQYRAEVELTSGDIVSASGAGVQIWAKRQTGWVLVHVTDISM